jgi:SAM-dependent methyltransferase
LKDSTVKKLNQINKEFYSQIAQSFSETRSYNWEGWDSLWEFIQENEIDVKRVLDLGCGNGRFLKFLNEKGWKGEYLGVDFDTQLLEIAGKSNSEINAKFQSHDIVMDLDNLEIKGEFDLIVCFGLMHHIPGLDKRIELMRFIEGIITLKGVVAIAFWMFSLEDRFDSHLVDWKELGIDPIELDRGDYLLDWRKDSLAYRYCHHYSESEIDYLIGNTRFTKNKKYRADGRSHRLNKYLILSQFFY